MCAYLYSRKWLRRVKRILLDKKTKGMRSPGIPPYMQCLRLGEQVMERVRER